LWSVYCSTSKDKQGSGKGKDRLGFRRRETVLTYQGYPPGQLHYTLSTVDWLTLLRVRRITVGYATTFNNHWCNRIVYYISPDVFYIPNFNWYNVF